MSMKVVVNGGSYQFFRTEIKALKEGEDSKTKVYTALCVLTSEDVDGKSLDFESDVKAKLSTINNLQLMQQTPIRVLHRRSNAVRLNWGLYCRK